MNRRDFLKAAIPAATVWQTRSSRLLADTRRPLNVLLFTADDLNGDSLGCFGSQVPAISPNLDRFATESIRFTRAHVNVAICQPSRGVLGTGRYPQNSGIMGFMHTDRDIPTIMETLRDAGYKTGVLGKVNHSTPKASFKWDFVHDQPELGAGRSPHKYYGYCTEFFDMCRREQKPFYFMVNSHDPHRPFHVPGAPTKKEKGAEPPSRIYKPSEIVVPGFVPDLPGVRQELSYYFNSVRRLDDTFGIVMRALDEAGLRANTIVTFLSDNGIAIPFAKCNAYLNSTHTPWMVRWPGVVEPGTVDTDHYISGIDFMPTTLDVLGLPPARGMDGRSYMPLLEGRSQTGRDRVFTQIDRKAGNGAVPMRCVQNARFGYIFNAWSDGVLEYHNNNEGLTWKAMVKAAPDNPRIADRIKMFRLRVVEEFYDLKKDPDCINNLVNNPAYRHDVDDMRTQMETWMVETGDPLIEAFRNRNSPAAMKAAFRKVYPERKKIKKNTKRAGRKRNANTKKTAPKQSK